MPASLQPCLRRPSASVAETEVPDGTAAADLNSKESGAALSARTARQRRTSWPRTRRGRREARAGPRVGLARPEDDADAIGTRSRPPGSRRRAELAPERIRGVKRRGCADPAPCPAAIGAPKALRQRRYRRNRRYAETMPETRGERIIFAIGALVIAALVALIVLETATDRFETRHTSAASKQVATGAAFKDAAASGFAGDLHRAGEHNRARDHDGRDDSSRSDADRKRRQADVERERRHMGRDSLRVGQRGRALLWDPSAGQREALPEHAFVGVIRFRREPHSPLERKAAAPAAWHLQRSRGRTRPEATRRLGQVHELSPSDKDEANKLLP